MKRKFYSELDASSDFALSIMASIQAAKLDAKSSIGLPVEATYNMASRYLAMYNIINKERSTLVDDSRILH